MEDDILDRAFKSGEQLELFTPPVGRRQRDFDTAVKTITKERGEAYGHPLDDFQIAADIKAALKSCKDPVVRHALAMIGVKMARLCTTPDHLDSLIDIAGYARTIAMIHDERDRRDGNR
jgi:hypothetical protein